MIYTLDAIAMLNHRSELGFKFGVGLANARGFTARRVTCWPVWLSSFLSVAAANYVVVVQHCTCWSTTIRFRIFTSLQQTPVLRLAS